MNELFLTKTDLDSLNNNENKPFLVFFHFLFKKKQQNSDFSHSNPFFCLNSNRSRLIQAAVICRTEAAALSPCQLKHTYED